MSPVPNTAGLPAYALGVIAGNPSINPFLSSLIPSENAGKEAVESIQIAASLETGHFDHDLALGDERARIRGEAGDD